MIKKLRFRLISSKKGIFFSLSLLILTYHGMATPSVLEIKADFEYANLLPYLHYYQDTTSTLTAKQIAGLQHKFVVMNRSTLHFGYSHHTHWLLFEIANNTSEKQSLFLDIPQTFIEDLALYQLTDSLPLSVGEYSVLKPFDTRSVTYTACALPLSIEAHTKHQYLLKVHNELAALRIPIFIRTTHNFNRETMLKHLQWGGLIGLLLVLCAGSLLTAFHTKSYANLLYGLYTLSMILFIIGLLGYGFAFIWGNAPWFEIRFRPFSIILQHVFIILFVIEYLDIRQYSTKIWYGLLILVITYILFSIIIFMPLSLLFKQKLISIFNILNIVTNSSLLAISIWRVRHKNIYALFYLIATTPFFMIALGLVLRNLNIIPDYPLLTSIQPYSFGFEALILAYSLAYRFKKIRDERENLVLEINKQQEKAIQALIEGQERERMRIGTELHDGLGHLLSIIKLNLSDITSLPEEKTNLVQTRALVEKALDEMREISHNLVPGVLQKVGLNAAIKEFVTNIKPHTTAQIDCFIAINEKSFSDELKLGIFRIIQETTYNAIKYARAHKISIQLTQEKNSIFLILEDDGIGFDREIIKNKSGNGIWHIQTRAKMLGAVVCEIDTAPGKGTVVFMEFLLP